MSRAPWTTTAAEKPYGFRVTIERTHNGLRENHTFGSKIPRRTAAVQAAGYKKGFLRLVSADPLTQQEWEKEFGAAPRSEKLSDPLSIACPTCHAKPGKHCYRPSGHRVFGGGQHASRTNAFREALES
ncbi:MAG TPA: hypothetical protein VNP98_17245 [Chthoniobacterales bacterium]|nr:hypothetical protein [Chthoniobacterales bacterium]